MRISDWSSDVCSSDLSTSIAFPAAGAASSAAGTRKPICPSGKRKATGEYAGEYVCRRLGFARPCFQDGRHGPPARGRRTKTGRPVDRKSTSLHSSPLMRISYAVFCLKKKSHKKQHITTH